MALERASMRPRLQDRGDVKWFKELNPAIKASMRPRLQDRGDIDNERATNLGRFELQCGHGSKTVEMGTTMKITRCWPGCFNAATAPRPWRCPILRFLYRRHRSFNAATAPRPWRFPGRVGKDRHLRGRLQCGHGSKTVEITKSLNAVDPTK